MEPKSTFDPENPKVGRFDYWDIAPPRTMAILKRHIASLESINPRCITAIYLDEDGDPVEDTLRLRRDGADPHGQSAESPLAIIYSSTLNTEEAPQTPITVMPTMPSIPTPILKAEPTAAELQQSRDHAIIDPKHPNKALTGAKPRGWVNAHSVGTRRYFLSVLLLTLMIHLIRLYIFPQLERWKDTFKEPNRHRSSRGNSIVCRYKDAPGSK